MSLRQDDTLYRRGTTAAVAGGVIQLVLAALVGGIGLWTASPAVHAACWHLLGGLPIWIILALLMKQHRIERAETLAAEKIARADARSAELFGDQADELSRVRARLGHLYNWGMKIVSTITAVYLLSVSLATLYANRAAFVPGVDSDALPVVIRTDISAMVLMGLFASLGFVSFVSARWISGYVRVPEWSILRGGASYLMGSALIVGLLFLGALYTTITGQFAAFTWLLMTIPVLMGLVGIEILLMMLLGAYRPRRPGEIPRPAFDSRLLGALTAPESLGRIIADTVNYQFGFEISRSWFYQLLSRAVLPLLLFSTCVMLALSSIVIVEPHEAGIISRFGTVTREHVEPGMHFKMPWPIEDYVTYPVARVQEVTFGTILSGSDDPAILWSTDERLDNATSGYYLTPASDGASGMSMVAVQLSLQYRVKDMRQFLLSSRTPGRLLYVVAEREATELLLSTPIETLLTDGRISTGEQALNRVRAAAEQLQMGVEVLDVSLVGVQPPRGSVTTAFHEQATAMQEAESAIEDARKFAVVTMTSVTGSTDHSLRLNGLLESIESKGRDLDTSENAALNAEVDELLWTSRGEVASSLAEARGYRWQRSIGEQAAASRYAGELEAFRRAPNYYRASRYLQAIANGLSERRKYVLAADSQGVPTFQMDLTDSSDALGTLLGE